MGKHNFSYALLPHLGTLQDAGVVQEGLRFNVPMIFSPSSCLVQKEGEANAVSFFSVDKPSVIIDTVKKAEDSNHVVVRLYEVSLPIPVVTITYLMSFRHLVAQRR